MSRQRKSRVTPLNDAADMAFAMTLLWAIPALAMVLVFTRL